MCLPLLITMGCLVLFLDYSISEKGKDFRRRRGQHKHGFFLGYYDEDYFRDWTVRIYPFFADAAMLLSPLKRHGKTHKDTADNFRSYIHKQS
jgi:hypothetical protein